MPSGGGGNNQDLFDTIMLQNKNSELTISPSSISSVKANSSGQLEINVTANSVWKVSTKSGFSPTYSKTSGIGNDSFSFEYGKNMDTNNTFNSRTSTILIKDIFYDRIYQLNDSDSTLNKHFKEITFTQLAKKELSVIGTINTQSSSGGTFYFELNSSFKQSNVSSNQSFCTIGSIIFDSNNEKLKIYVTLSENATNQDREAKVTVNTEDNQNIEITIQQERNLDN